MATPLAGPVVPEVKKIEARLCGVVSGRAAWPSAASSCHGAAARPPDRSSSIASAWRPVSITQNRSIIEVCGPSTARRAASTSSTMAQRGAEVTTWWRRNSPSYATLIGTSTRSASPQANQDRTKAEELAAMISTRSPGTAPTAHRPRASASVSARMSPYVHCRPSSGVTRKTASGCSAARARRIAGSVHWPGSAKVVRRSE